MRIHTHQAKENKSKTVVAEKKIADKPTFQFVDNRPEAVRQGKLQTMTSSRIDNQYPWINQQTGPLKVHASVSEPVVQRVTNLSDADLLMKSGSLNDLFESGIDSWNDLAKKLSELYLPKQHDMSLELQRENFIELCTLTIQKEGKDIKWAVIPKDADGSKYVDRVLSVVQELMNLNGQTNYLIKQPWFKSGKYYIEIDVNYYPDRSGFEDALRFHKDTGGNNIFVNLIFDNKSDIDATEWFPDASQPSKKRLEWQKKILPKRHLKKLAVARKNIRESMTQDSLIAGGKSKENAYVSWVDDLIWHSTPYRGKREEIGHDEIFALFEQSYDEIVASKWLEILGAIALDKRTHLNGWLKDEESSNLDYGMVGDIWNKLYEGDTGNEKFQEDVGKLPNKIKIIGKFAEANAKDSRLGNASKSIYEPPVELITRNRANSLSEPDNDQSESSKKPRSFLRTWVKIMRKEKGRSVKKAKISGPEEDKSNEEQS